jgi:hypothetical protein
MKWIPTAAFLALLIAPAPRARAADPSGENALDRGGAAGREWKEKLGLGSDQLAKFIAALRTRDDDLQPLRDQFRGGVRKLRTQLSENASEKDVLDSLQQLSRLRKAIALRSDQFDAQVAAFLAPSQRGKLFVWESLSAEPVLSARDAQPGDPRAPAPNAEAEEEQE